MTGNYHARFLKGKGVERPLTYLIYRTNPQRRQSLRTIFATVIFALTFTLAGCDKAQLSKTGSVSPKNEDLNLTEQEIIDTYIYVLGRYLVVRQEHIDMTEEGVDYNTIKYNELGCD